MKFLISFLLISIFYISLSESACSNDNYKPVENVELLSLTGKWYVAGRYANGQHGNSHCIWSTVFKHPTLEDTLVESTNLMFKNGDKKSKKNSSGNLTLVDPKKKNGIIRVDGRKGSSVTKVIVALDDEYALLMGCHKKIEYFWIYLKSLNPTEETKEKINKSLTEQNLDYTKVVSS